MARLLLVQATQASFVCKRRLPLNESIDLSVDERIVAGDLEAIHDMARDAIAELETIADRAAGLLCDEPDALKRLAEVRRRRDDTGKAWHGQVVSGQLKDADSTDRAGTEPRGPRRGQERTRRATGGKPATKRGRRC